MLLRSFGQADRGLDDPTLSSTYEYLSGGFNDSYTTTGSWSGAAGSWALDTFNIGGIDISQVQFGIGYNSTWIGLLPTCLSLPSTLQHSDPFKAPGSNARSASNSTIYTLTFIDGTLALGYLQSESNGNTYNNLPALMLSNGLIECAAYSLWLDKINTSHGQLIFGGVNTDKFLGTLESFSATLPTVNNVYIMISLSKMSISYNGGSFILQDTALQVSPDAGSSWMYLPPSITDPLFAQFGATYDPDLVVTWIPCIARENTSTIDFTFGATTIAVSMDELVQDYNSSICYFGIIPSSLGVFLGVTFLRSAYIVFDLSHNFVWLAPSNSKPSGDNIVPIGSAGVKTLTGIPTSTPHTSPSPSISSTPAHHHLSTGAKAGIGVGVGVGALLLILLLVCSIMSRRRRTRQQSSHLRPASHTPGQPMRQTFSEVDTGQSIGPLPVTKHMSQVSGEVDHGLSRPPLSANSASSDYTRVGYDARTPYELDAATQNIQASWYVADEGVYRT